MIGDYKEARNKLSFREEDIDEEYKEEEEKDLRDEIV